MNRIFPFRQKAGATTVVGSPRPYANPRAWFVASSRHHIHTPPRSGGTPDNPAPARHGVATKNDADKTTEESA